MEKSLKPLVKWMGSKFSFRDTIIQEIQNLGYTGTYFEPFVGCGSVLLGLKPQKAVINDLNSQLINAWSWLKQAPEALIEAYKRLDCDPVSSDYYYQIRDEHNNYRNWGAEHLRAAAVFIWLTRHSFNGLYRTRKDGYFNANWNKQEHAAVPDFDNWRAIGKYLSENDVRILNTDFSYVMAMVKPGDLVYADPPYAVGTGEKAHSQPVYGGFDIYKDSERVAISLSVCPGAVVCSNNDNDVVRTLYTEDKWEYKPIAVRRAFHGSRGNIDYSKRAELLLIKKTGV